MRLLIGILLLGAWGCVIEKGGTVAAPSSVPTLNLSSALCVAPFPQYGGNDINPPTGGCFYTGTTRAIVDAAIARQPQDTWGLSGHGHAFAQQLPDGTWIIAVNK
jgi:hypothetical protein